MTDPQRPPPARADVLPAARPVRRAAHVRLWAALLFGVAAAMLFTAARLAPDPSGYGTHRQLGSGPCGMLLLTGYPCPTCGMTTAFALTVRGRFWAALLVQPAGFVLALATAGLAVASGWTFWIGRWPRWNLWRVNPYWLFLALLVLLLGSWAFKIALGLAQGTLPAR